MTTYIGTLVNNSAGAVALVDNQTGGCVCVPAGQTGHPNWQIKTELAQAILGPGQTNVGPGTYDWIWDDGNYNILIQRAGTFAPRVLITVGFPFVITIAYNSDGTVTATEGASAAAVGASKAEHAMA